MPPTTYEVVAIVLQKNWILALRITNKCRLSLNENFNSANGHCSHTFWLTCSDTCSGSMYSFRVTEFIGKKILLLRKVTWMRNRNRSSTDPKAMVNRHDRLERVIMYVVTDELINISQQLKDRSRCNVETLLANILKLERSLSWLISCSINWNPGGW